MLHVVGDVVDILDDAARWTDLMDVIRTGGTSGPASSSVTPTDAANA